MTSSELLGQADALVDLAFSQNPIFSSNGTRSEALDSAAKSLRLMVDESLEYATEHLDQGLRGAAFLACLPSIQTIATGRQHDREIAAKVVENFQELSEDTLSRPGLRTRTIRGRDGPAVRDRVVGRWSEIGVHGILWWSIAHGLREERSYVLPATQTEDSGKRTREGYSLATDLVMRESGKKSKQLIQIKTSTHSSERAAINRYYPGMVIVAVSRLLKDRHPDPRKLLELLATNDSKALGEMSERLDDDFSFATVRAAMHQQFKQREASRYQAA